MRAVGIEPEPKLPAGAACDFHNKREATNITMVRGADFYLCRECFLSRLDAIAATMTPNHPISDRRPV